MACLGRQGICVLRLEWTKLIVFQSLFADILSVLAMTYSDTQPRGTLRYRLLSASLRPADSPLADPGTWGHEYVRHLAAELGEEFVVQEQGELEDKPDDKKVAPIGTIEELRSLGRQCATFLLAHNAEPDAVDLLEELEIVDQITELVDENTYGRVCQYMVRCVNLLPPPDDIAFLQTAHTIYVQQSKFPEALALAIRLGDPALVREDFNAPGNPLMKRQLAFLLARAQIPLHWLKNPEADETADFSDDLPEDLVECLSNTRLSGHFRDFGKELGVQDAKSLEDVYKSHLEHTRTHFRYLSTGQKLILTKVPMLSQMWILPEAISLALLSTPSSMQVSGMTNSW